MEESDTLRERLITMKKNIGPRPVLYPTPLIVVGAMNGENPTWTLVAHIGIPSHDRVMVSLATSHFINQFVKGNEAFSVNVVDEGWLKEADYVGSVSGAKTSKADAFAWTAGEAGSPIINDAKVAMELKVEDIYELGTFENFICSVLNTYADETVLNEKGKVDYTAFKPVLFEMPNYTYLATGEKLGDCLRLRG